MATPIKSHSRGALSRATRWGSAGAAGGAVCAALYGLIFGEAEIMVAGAVWRLLPFVGYFALCGFIAGALTGAVAGLLDGHLNGKQ